MTLRLPHANVRGSGGTDDFYVAFEARPGDDPAARPLVRQARLHAAISGEGVLHFLPESFARCAH